MTPPLLSRALASRASRECYTSLVISARCAKCLIEIGDDIIAVLNADAEPDHLWPHASLTLLFDGHLSMRRGRGMTCQRLGVADIDQPLEQFECVVELFTGLQAADDTEGQQRTGVAAKVLLGERVVRIVWETRVGDPLDPRVLAQKLGYPLAILDVALDAQRKRLDTLQQKESAQRCQDRTGCALTNAATPRNVGGHAITFSIDEAVVRRLRFVQHGEPAPMLPPWKFSAIDDDPAKGCAMSAHEFRQRMNNDVGTIVDRP